MFAELKAAGVPEPLAAVAEPTLVRAVGFGFSPVELVALVQQYGQAAIDIIETCIKYGQVAVEVIRKILVIFPPAPVAPPTVPSDPFAPTV
jgi:hypothetical protein